MQAVQGAMAIRRQRHRRQEQVRAKARRRSSLASDQLMMSPTQMSLQSLAVGGVGVGGGRAGRAGAGGGRGGGGGGDSKMLGTATTLHVGVVLVLIGVLCVVSALVPPQKGASGGDWRERLATGCFLLFVGLVLSVVNRVVAKQEEDKFRCYIRRKLEKRRPLPAPPSPSPAPLDDDAESPADAESPPPPPMEATSPVAAAEHHVHDVESPRSASHLESIVEELELDRVAQLHHHHIHHVHHHQTRIVNEVAPVHQPRPPSGH